MDFPTLAVPIPMAWVGRLLAGYLPWFLIIISEFELRSTMINMVDLTFHHSCNIALGSKMQKDMIKLFTTLILNMC